jgi:hypothetical protein
MLLRDNSREAGQRDRLDDPEAVTGADVGETQHQVQESGPETEEQKRLSTAPRRWSFTSVRVAPVLTAAFFCGLHRSPLHDVHAQPSEMALSLLLQVIEQSTFSDGVHVPDGEIQTCRENIDPEDVNSVMAVFERLVTQGLPPHAMLFIIFDGLGLVSEDEEHRVEVARIVEVLFRIAKQSNEKRGKSMPTVKLLLTSPTRTEFLEGIVDEKDVLDLPQLCPPRGRYSHTKFRELMTLDDDESYVFDSGESE